MAKSKIVYIVVSSFLIFCGGCAQKYDRIRPLAANADTSKIGLVNFTLETVNENGEAVSSFEENQNIVLSFTILNGDSKPLLINYWDFPISNPDFFLINRYTDEGKVPVGKSFQLGANTRDLVSQTIPAYSKAVYEVPWLVKNNFYMPLLNNKADELKSRRYGPHDPAVKALVPGRYNSEFSMNINGQQLKMSIDFDVK